MSVIARDLKQAARSDYDIIIIGGGIYGAALSYEAGKRGLRSLLVERDDFGAATSFNSLRIIHGGLRYLQTADLTRFRESVQERRWFLQAFPELVHPLPFLMPLYGQGLRRPAVLRMALVANDLLSLQRNRGVRRDRHLPRASVVDAATTQQLFPKVDSDGLKGAALWYDGCMPDSQRVIIEVLRRASVLGGYALNYVEAVGLLKVHGAVQGIVAQDREAAETHHFSAPVVVNATGPWSRVTARRFHEDREQLFHSSIAWNILFDHDALSDHALVVSPKRFSAQAYFLHPWKGRILAGTGHAPWDGEPGAPQPSTQQQEWFLRDLNDAIPGLDLKHRDIVRVFAGLLPAKDKTRAQLAVREVMVDHGAQGGPRGLFSISGVKFTTSRLVAEKCLRRIFGRRRLVGRTEAAYPAIQSGWELDPAALLRRAEPAQWLDPLRRLIGEEAVVHLDDLFLRRTTLWEDTGSAVALAPQVCQLFAWGPGRCERELARLRDSIGFPETMVATAGESFMDTAGEDADAP